MIWLTCVLAVPYICQIKEVRKQAALRAPVCAVSFAHFFKTAYLHRGETGVSAGFPAGISGLHESAAGKLGLLEEVWPFSPFHLKGSRSKKKSNVPKPG